MTQDKKQILGHVLACGTQIMWGATAFIALLTFFPHHLKLKNPKQEFAFAGADYSELFSISCWKIQP